jgi:hypothetical protein
MDVRGRLHADFRWRLGATFAGAEVAKLCHAAAVAAHAADAEAALALPRRDACGAVCSLLDANGSFTEIRGSALGILDTSPHARTVQAGVGRAVLVTPVKAAARAVAQVRQHQHVGSAVGRLAHRADRVLAACASSVARAVHTTGLRELIGALAVGILAARDQRANPELSREVASHAGRCAGRAAADAVHAVAAGTLVLGRTWGAYRGGVALGAAEGGARNMLDATDYDDIAAAREQR